MAAPKSTAKNRIERRHAMIEMRKRGVSYGIIAMKFGIARDTARNIVMYHMKSDPAPKPDKYSHRSHSHAVRVVRNRKMVKYREAGMTLREIGDRFKITPQNVFKILKRLAHKRGVNDQNDTTTNQ